jgi:hypothetical protein
MHTHTEKLPVALTSEEIGMKASELSRTIDHKAKLELQKKETLAKYAEHIKGYDRRIGDLAGEIRAGVEYREIPCFERQNFETCCIEVVRTDTQEVIRHETMTAKQRQKEMFDPAPLDAVTEGGEGPADEEDDDEPGSLSEQYEKLAEPIDDGSADTEADGPGDDDDDDDDGEQQPQTDHSEQAAAH